MSKELQRLRVSSFHCLHCYPRDLDNSAPRHYITPQVDIQGLFDTLCIATGAPKVCPSCDIADFVGSVAILVFFNGKTNTDEMPFKYYQDNGWCMPQNLYYLIGWWVPIASFSLYIVVSLVASIIYGCYAKSVCYLCFHVIMFIRWVARWWTDWLASL